MQLKPVTKIFSRGSSSVKPETNPPPNMPRSSQPRHPCGPAADSPDTKHRVTNPFRRKQRRGFLALLSLASFSVLFFARTACAAGELSAKETLDRLLEAFKDQDPDNTGYVNKDTFVTLLTQIGVKSLLDYPVNLEESYEDCDLCHNCFGLGDVDEDGNIFRCETCKGEGTSNGKGFNYVEELKILQRKLDENPSWDVSKLFDFFIKGELQCDMVPTWCHVVDEHKSNSESESSKNHDVPNAAMCSKLRNELKGLKEKLAEQCDYTRKMKSELEEATADLQKVKTEADKLKDIITDKFKINIPVEALAFLARADGDDETSKFEDVFACPITKELLKDPVTTVDGHTYERAAIKQWFDDGNRTSPLTGAQLLTTHLRPNHLLRSMIESLQGAGLLPKQ